MFKFRSIEQQLENDPGEVLVAGSSSEVIRGAVTAEDTERLRAAIAVSLPEYFEDLKQASVEDSKNRQS